MDGSYDPGISDRLKAMEVKGAAFDSMGAVKDAKSRLSTNSSGLWTRTYPAGFWVGEPSINVSPISATAGAGPVSYRVTKTLTAGSWKVDVQFTMIPATADIKVLGVLALTASPGTVVFDYSAVEPNAA